MDVIWGRGARRRSRSSSCYFPIIIDLTSSSSSFDAHGFKGGESRRPGHKVAAMLVTWMALDRDRDRVGVKVGVGVRISVLLVRMALMEKRVMITTTTTTTTTTAKRCNGEQQKKQLYYYCYRRGRSSHPLLASSFLQ
jgi:hypothetical protein